ncbi:MAG TPA: cation transporting ATPase C-terminal domain-containing protein, partial [Tetragenococcus sp.]|nr:cation transporting ATPase C-terminal domain-containing protein [Tetragenococcus sp.]
LLMWFVFGANTVSDQALFQTGWFAIGLTTQTLAVYILRTQKIPFVQSHASIHVTLASIAAIVLGAAFVLTPLGEAIDFVALPSMYWFYFVLIILGYLLTLQIAKHFYAHYYGQNN